MQSLRIRPITPNPPVHLKHFFIFPVLPTPNSPSSHPQPIPSAVTNQKGATFQTVYEKTPIFSMNTHRTSIFPSRSVSTSTAKSETTTCGSQQSQNLAAEPYCLMSSSFSFLSLYVTLCPNHFRMVPLQLSWWISQRSPEHHDGYVPGAQMPSKTLQRTMVRRPNGFMDLK